MLYSKPYFEQRIKEEKLRSWRSGSQFSMVSFDPLKLIHRKNGTRRKVIEAIGKILDEESRESDIKGLWNKHKLAVLLSDTSPEKAFRFVDKFVLAIQANFDPVTKPIDKSYFKVHTFPRAGQVQKNEKTRSSNDSNRKHLEVNYLTDLEVADLSIWKGPTRRQKVIKRILDIILSVTVFIVLSPVFLLCAISIKLDSPGPVFYKQPRIGEGGRCFTFLKFRSMSQKADSEVHRNHIKNLVNHTAGLSCSGNGDEKSYKIVEDERVTRVGEFIRRTSLDELPQFLNVLKGDMSLVGPRPHPVYEVNLYNHWYRHRLDVKPGITCLGQIYGRYNTEYENVFRYDLQYLKKASLFLDLKILFKTIPIVLSRRGAY